jgi:hypothetical protein
MIAISKPVSNTIESKHDERFLELVPAIKRYARLSFRQLQSQEGEEGVCEVVGYAYCAFRRLAELGRLDVAYAQSLARHGVARFRTGRRVGSGQNTRDVFSAAAQGRPGVSLASLSATYSGSETWEEALADNRSTPILDQVAFRLDFAAWLRHLSCRDRALIVFLSFGNTSKEAAERFEVSRARISQLRSELKSSWQAFQGDYAFAPKKPRKFEAIG